MRKNKLIGAAWLTGVLGLALVACSGAPAIGSDVGQPLSDGVLLTIDDIPLGYTGPIVHDVGATSAWVRFDTGIPTVCNVAYGPTTQYGDIASLPMLDGATLDHDLQLLGLEPDTLHHYRFTLVDEEGIVYRSVDFTFTTLTVEEAEAQSDKPDGVKGRPG